MSASEKLAAFSGELYVSPGGPDDPATDDIWPLIIAVVRAAERHLHLHDPSSRQETRPLWVALAALDAKLDGTDWSKEQVGQEGC